ncbi:MAG: LamG-like jellyroll fold domain-containing protein, partial [Planctomycetota bacterium]
MSKRCFALVYIVLALVLAHNASAALVGQWKLDEGGGTIAIDASGNGNDGTLEDDPVVVDGQFGQALAFDASRVTIPASDTLTADLFQGSFTLTAWINASRTGNTWQQIFRSVRSGDTNDTLFINNDGRLSWRGRVNGAWAGGMCETSPDVVAAGQWTHVAVTGDGTNFRVYVNGTLSQESPFQTTDGANVTYYIGGDMNFGESYTGMVDDLRVYDHVLSEADIRASMENQGGAIVKSYGPDPQDGAMLEATWVTLSWRAGDLALSHDVYLGENFDDVNNGAADTFQGNQAATMLIAGFAGFPYPEGLAPGTTYYWRVDGVNPGEPNSPWKGDVWSFWIPPKTAWQPVPADGARFVAPDVELTWTPGFGAKLHTVYFGETFEEVDNAAGGVAQANAMFAVPGPLEPEKTYYWRVDEFDVVATHKGPVWSFEIAKEGGGVKGEYFQGMVPGGIPVLTRTDPQIDFSWGNNAPDPAVGEDNFSCRWTGQVEAVFTETYTFYTNSDDGVRLWVDGKQLINNWTDHGNTEDRGKIDLVAGQTYSVVMEMYENGGGAV